MSSIPCPRSELGAAAIGRGRSPCERFEPTLSHANKISRGASMHRPLDIFIYGGEGGIIRATRSPFGPPLRALSPLRGCHSWLIQTHENLHYVWRRGRDSNPRRAFDPYALSRGAPSTTRPPLRIRPKRPFAERGMIPARSSLGKTKGIYGPFQASSTILAAGAPAPESCSCSRLMRSKISSR
jgi:hypothetical protein